MASTRNFFAALSARKVRALLAGGLVLGLGATATLAAYSDSEWATATFSADAVAPAEPDPTLILEASRDNSAWSDDVTMTMSVNSDKMVTGQYYYAPIWVRLAAGTYLPGTGRYATVTFGGSNITAIEPSVSAIAANTNVELHTPSNGRCDSGMVSGGLYRSARMNASTVSSSERIYPGPDENTAGPALMYCMRFELMQRPTNPVPHSATAQWTVTAVEAV